ncbi:hypothetical protein [Pseudonocardia sp. ICBG601]|nr:hypothetical protein [Pseudonocardia sp. ICBG601]
MTASRAVVRSVAQRASSPSPPTPSLLPLVPELLLVGAWAAARK